MMWRNAGRDVPHVGEAGRLYGGKGRKLWLTELAIRGADRTDASRLFPIVVIP